VLISGIAACAESDIKKIIALSTLRQLGLIMSSLGMGERSLCFAHLNAHATVKALLFMVVGSVIHGSYGNQEVRCSAFILRTSPGLSIMLGVASASLCGLVFLSGAVTKDAVLLSFYNIRIGSLGLCLFYLGIFLTVAYSSRLFYLFSSSRASASRIQQISGLSLAIKCPMYLLVILAIVQGLVFDLRHGLTSVFVRVADSVLIWALLLLGSALGCASLWAPVSLSSPLTRLG